MLGKKVIYKGGMLMKTGEAKIGHRIESMPNQIDRLQEEISALRDIIRSKL